MSKLSRCFNFIVVLVLVVTLFASRQPVKAQAGVTGVRDKSGNSTAPFVPGEVIVGFESGKKLSAYTAQATGLADALGGTVARVSANGAALLQVAPEADVQALADQLSGQAGVKFAEPNYVFSLPPLVKAPAVNHDFVLQRVAKGDEALFQGKTLRAVRVSDIEQHPVNSDTGSGSKITTTYPNDPYLWENNGWSWVGADIVWTNTTASAGVCEIDTGVDYTHPDLTGRVIKGYDIVNDDPDPMDDFGHGTAVAGILVANQNNKQGMAGVSTGKVVAVKVLNAQGSGTAYDVALGIIYCASRSDIKVISMSLGSPADSDFIWSAVNTAINNNKLIVAAAGNNSNENYQFPAAYSIPFPNRVLAVAASGAVVDVYDASTPPVFQYSYIDNNCMAEFSTYGDWISVVAPGMGILTTMPWDKPFYLNYYNGYATRYDYFSGTSAAAPFVAATAARRWGLKPTENNYSIGQDVISSHSGYNVDTTDASCWPTDMGGIAYANVATALERFGLIAAAYDAVTGLPLVGAQIQSFQGTTLRGTGVVTPTTAKYFWDFDPARVYTSYTAFTEILNLPNGYGYDTKVSKPGYTSGAQRAYQHKSWGTYSGYYGFAGITAVPPLSSKFELTMGWLSWFREDYATHSVNGTGDLDMNVWIPGVPNNLDPSYNQPFIVGMEGKDYGLFEGDPTGETGMFPHALLQREGGWRDPLPVETIVIDSRKAHAPLAANPALPYYPGIYAGVITDYGQTIDNDGDGCGDNYYGASGGYDPDYDNTCGGSGTPGIPLLGAYLTPYVYVWKDGAVKLFSGMVDYNGGNPYSEGDSCNAREWAALSVYTLAVAGPVNYYHPGGGTLCGDHVGPYVNLPGVNSRANLKNWLNVK